jgi:glycosyltransferase involved in cell wall biosynthesis
VARELRRFRPEVVIVQGAQETGLVLLGRALARSSARVVLDLHGDWRVPTRLYGSRWRALLTPISDALAGLAVRRADAVRTITPFTSGLVRAAGREPDAEFPAFMDLEAFTDQPVAPLPLSPTALFVGVLEPYKAIDILAAGWPIVAGRVEGATLRIVGKGTLEGTVQRLVDADPRVGWDRELSATEVARALDAAAVLVLPSRSEGMGRIVVEAFCRGRPVVGSSVGGIPDLVRNGENGLLVTPGDATALADALASVLSDRMLLERLSRGALAAAGAWTASPAEWATRMRRLVDKVAAQAGSSASNSP